MVKAMLRGERAATPYAFMAMVGVLFLLLATTSLTLAYRGQVSHIQRTLYERCLARVHYDQASNNARRVEITQFRHLGVLALDSIQLTPQQRQERAEAYTAMADSLEKAIAAEVSTDCTRYQ